MVRNSNMSPRILHFAHDRNLVPEPDATCLPFARQHKLMVDLQKYLEAVCYAYARENIPEVLQKRGWQCAEAVQLSTWMDEFRLRRHLFDGDLSTEDLEGLFRSVAKIRDAAVCRTPTDLRGVQKLVADAAQLVEVLEVEPYKDLIDNIRLGVVKAIESLGQEEHMLRERQRKKLAQIARERAKLDELERSVLAETGKDLSRCQYSAGLEVRKALEEAEKTFGIESFFESLG